MKLCSNFKESSPVQTHGLYFTYLFRIGSEIAIAYQHPFGSISDLERC